MTPARRLIFTTMLLGLVVPAAASRAAADGSWDGAWRGSLQHLSDLALTVANDKVVSYTIGGAPVAVSYTKVTPTSLSFGDRDHFSMKLTRTSDTTASASAHGRNGYGSGTFKKE
jgi:hypothetical protein